MKKTIISKAVLLNLVVISLLFACEKVNLIEPIPPSENPSFLVGKWIEKEPEGIGQFAGANHIIEFTDSLFLLERHYWTDVISSEDCENDYTAYFKGAIQIDQDSISFNGVATNSNYEIVNPECDRYAVFKSSFAYKKEGTNILILNPNEDTYYQIQLEKK